jgi:hypothetical protein
VGFEENRRRRFTLKRSWLEELGKGKSLSVVNFFKIRIGSGSAAVGLVGSEITFHNSKP